MKVPLKWLGEYVKIACSPEELAESLTMAGLEVGAVEIFAPLDEKFVVAEIEKLSPHPRDQKLQLATVNSGEELLTIVCGAGNIKKGVRVVLALPGATLPAGGEIRATTIKGSLSQGMLCSARELALELVGESDGVLLIEEECAPGSPLREVLPVYEPVLDLELTPNRADCWGLLGVAREVSVLTGQSLRLPPVHVQEKDQDIRELAHVNIKEPELCFRYTAKIMEGIKIGPSPLKIQLRLLAAGIRPINNIVDITNYVMWETGQPMHAFDFKKVRDGHIIVRRALPGEGIITLDGVQREIDGDNLVIADSRAPIGLAGVMGGEYTEITPRTQQVLLEAACFQAANIRRTARRLNLLTEAFQRFEKGVDPEGIMFAQERAVHLMQETAGGQALRGVIDSYPRPWEKILIKLRPWRVEDILGYSVNGEEIKGILEKLGAKVQIKTEEGMDGDSRTLYLVEVPSYRKDLKMEIDLVEEIVRIKGYDTIPATLPVGPLTSGRLSWARRVTGRIKDILIACGLQEVITFSFMNPRLFDVLNLPANDPRRNAVWLQNPLTEEQAVMRTTLIANLLQIMQYNFNHQVENQFFFELGKCFFPVQKKNELPRERLLLSLLLSGNPAVNDWQQRASAVDFYFLKGIVETLLQGLGIGSYGFVPAQLPVLHPTRGAELLIDGKKQGILGALHPRLQEKMEFKQEVYLAELDLEDLLEKADLWQPFEPLPRFPAVLRDVAFIIPEQVSAEALFQTLKQCGGKLLEKVTLFDVYKGNQIPEGHLSLAFSLIFRHRERTLQDEEIDAIQANMERRLAEKYHALLRKE